MVFTLHCLSLCNVGTRMHAEEIKRFYGLHILQSQFLHYKNLKHNRCISEIDLDKHLFLTPNFV